MNPVVTVDSIWQEVSREAILLGASDKQHEAINVLSSIPLDEANPYRQAILSVNMVDDTLDIMVEEASEGKLLVDGVWGHVLINQDGATILNGPRLPEPFIWKP